MNFNPLHREGGDPPIFPQTSPLLVISIHSTARVETAGGRLRMRTMIYFNPLHREGGDPGASILHQLFDYFNPLHREGGDQVYPDVSFLYSEFQSTPPRGWRQFLPAVFPHTYNFNPLHREGGDLRYRYWGGPEKISIHSTARVETHMRPLHLPQWNCNFNPLHREGGDTV